MFQPIGADTVTGVLPPPVEAHLAAERRLAISQRVGTVSILDFATTPIGVGNANNDTAALKAGIEGARVAKCNLSIPAIKLQINEAITLPNIQANVRKVGLVGAGIALTELQWVVDLGANQFGIRTTSGNNDVGECFLMGLLLTGPTRTRVLEQAPCQMEGVEASRKMHFVDVQSSYFKAGFRLNGDHVSFLRCYVSNSYFGVYYKGATIAGDISYIECDLTGTTMATIGIGVGGILAATSMVRGHVGFSPYGFYAEPGVAATASDHVAYSAFFYGTSFEAFGAAVCYDEDNLGIWSDFHFMDIGNMSMLLNLAGSDYTNPSRGRPGLFRMASMYGFTFTNTSVGTNGETYPDSLFDCKTIDNSVIRGSIVNFFNGYVSAGKKLISATGTGNVDIRVEGQTRSGFFRRTSAAVTANTLVGFDTLGKCKPHTGAEQLLGVAAYSEATVNAGVLIIESGERIKILSNTNLGVNERVVVDPTAPTKVAALSLYPTAPVVGTLWFGNLVAGQTGEFVFRTVATSSATPSGAAPMKYATGFYYTAAGGKQAAGRPNGLMSLTPIRIDSARTFAGLAVQVTTAGSAGAVVRLGLYSNTGRPGARIADLGTVDATTTGVKTITTPIIITSPGWYYLAAVIQGAPTTLPNLMMFNPGNVLDGAPTDPTAFNIGAGWQIDGTTGALPADGSPATVAGATFVVAIVA